MSRKGTIYAGCSFTWGQGLWMYYEGDDVHVPSAQEYTIEHKRIPEQAFKLRKTLGWPQMVSDYLGTEPIVKRYNGGCDEETVRFIEMVFGEPPHHKGMLKENFDLDEVEYIIIQTTQPYRSPFYFDYKGQRYMVKGTPNLRNLDHVNRIAGFGEELFTALGHLIIEEENLPLEIFLDYLIDNGKTLDDFKHEHIQRWTNELSKILKKYHDLGKKVYLLSWTDEYLDYIKKDSFLNERFIKLTYKDKVYDCIEYLQVNEDKEGERMYIDTENYNNPNRKPGMDTHPSKLCHKIIAENVIQAISNKNKLI